MPEGTWCALQLAEQEDEEGWSASDGEGGFAADAREPDAPASLCVALSKLVHSLRHVLLLFWLVVTVGLAPFAYLLLGKVATFPKEPLRNTESAAAKAIFDEHFGNLAAMKRESVVFRCRRPCESAANELTSGLVLEVQGIVERFGREHPGTIIHVHSYYTYEKITENPMIAFDHQSILLQWLWQVPEGTDATAWELVDRVQEAVEEMNNYEAVGADGAGIFVAATGPTFVERAIRITLVEEIPKHELTSLWLPFSILACALRSVRMLFVALLSMPVRIFVAFGLTYFIALRTTVLSEALMEMLVVCTGLSFDYSLFTLRRYAEELELGASVQEAVLQTILHSGHVVLVTGFVLMVAFGAMMALPGPFKSFCTGCCTMIFVCVGVQLTLVPALLGVFPWLGGAAAQSRPADGDVAHAVIRSKSTESARSGGEDAVGRASPYMHGLWFWAGGHLTTCPLNILVPCLLFAGMAPLTMRMDGIRMGHGFNLEVPRHRKEWATALQIQQDFSSQVGCFYPMLIIATRALPTDLAEAEGRSGGAPPPTLPATPPRLLLDKAQGANTTSQPPSEAPPPAPQGAESPPAPEPQLDVRSQEFFDANCHMVNALINATKGRSYALHPSDFQSATFYAEVGEEGPVECLNFWLTHQYRKNPLAQKFFATSKLLEDLWEQLVSSNHDAMLTLLNPALDPFSTEAFALVRDVRAVLRNVTLAAAGRKASVPGLSFSIFCAAGAMIDCIALTEQRLPIAMLVCVTLSFLLVGLSFRAVCIPVSLLFTVFVPMTWTYGAALYVYDDGVLAWTGIPGLMPTAGSGIHWTVYMLTPCLMVGLALDYSIFLLTRVWEFRNDGFGDRESIQLGLAATGPIISQAGLIFSLTFVMMMMGSVPASNQMGFVLVISILIDTFIVRTVLVPAMLSLWPCMNYWPSRMPEVRYEWLPGSCSRLARKVAAPSPTRLRRHTPAEGGGGAAAAGAREPTLASRSRSRDPTPESTTSGSSANLLSRRSEASATAAGEPSGRPRQKRSEAAAQGGVGSCGWNGL